MDYIKKIIDKIVEIFCISILAIMTVLVTYQVISRYFFNSPSAISEVLSRYLFIWLVLFGAAYVFGKREHMNIAFIKDKMPFKVGIVFDLIGEAAVVFFAIFVMILGGYKGALRQLSQMDSSLPVSIGLIYSAIPISGLLIVFYFLCNVLNIVKKLLKGEQK